MDPILILSILLVSLAASEAGSTTAVLDVTGRELQRGAEYHILPARRGGDGGGGLILATRNGSCPLNVAQERDAAAPGLPVTFLPVNPGDKAVRLSTDANVVFAAATACAQSTVWRLGSFDESYRRYYLTVGGVTGNPGLATVGNWFKIKRYGEDGYSIEHCPNVCSFCKVICKDVGVLYEMKRWWLGLADVPFPVVFQRVRKAPL